MTRSVYHEKEPMLNEDQKMAVVAGMTVSGALSVIILTICLGVAQCNSVVVRKCSDSCGKERLVRAETDKCICVGGEPTATQEATTEAALAKAKQQAMTDALRAISKAYEK